MTYSFFARCCICCLINLSVKDAFALGKKTRCFNCVFHLIFFICFLTPFLKFWLFFSQCCPLDAVWCEQCLIKGLHNVSLLYYFIALCIWYPSYHACQMDSTPVNMSTEFLQCVFTSLLYSIVPLVPSYYACQMDSTPLHEHRASAMCLYFIAL